MLFDFDEYECEENMECKKYTRRNFNPYKNTLKWFIKKVPEYPKLFKKTNTDFIVSDLRKCSCMYVPSPPFYAILERRYADESCTDTKLEFSLVLKEGHADIYATNKISVTDSKGKAFYKCTRDHKCSSNSPFVDVMYTHEEKAFKKEDYEGWTFNCTIECASTALGLGYLTLNTSATTSNTLVDDLKAMYANSLHTDLTLKVEESSLHAHKALLCARSPVFAKMFQSPMDEQKENVIQIPDIKLPIVKGLMEFLYTGVLRDQDFEFVYDMYYAADKYDVSSLHKTCIAILMAGLTVENACLIAALANRHSDQQFKDSVMDFILRNLDDVLETDSFDEIINSDTKLAAEVMRSRRLKDKKGNSEKCKVAGGRKYEQTQNKFPK